MTDPSILGSHPNAGAWFDAIGRRRSRRTYDASPVPDDVLAPLKECCSGFRPFGDVRVEFVARPPVDVYRGVVGSYGKVSGAPHLLAIVAGDGPLAQQHAGYVGEACVLEATRLGLDTCWVGGFFSRGQLASFLPLGPGERAVAVSPVGHAFGGHSGSERALERMAGSHQRKPLEEIAPGNAGWPRWARSAVECARLAPSATNRQPWRFRFEAEELVVEMSRGPELPVVTKRLDCGIAMLHAELGAYSAGVSGTWRESPDDREVARFEPREVR